MMKNRLIERKFVQAVALFLSTPFKVEVEL